MMKPTLKYNSAFCQLGALHMQGPNQGTLILFVRAIEERGRVWVQAG